MIAVANAVEPLRMANRVSGQTAYEWLIVSLDGEPVTASNGLTFTPTDAARPVGPVDIVFVCGGINVREAVSPALADRVAAAGRQAHAARRAVHRAVTRSRRPGCSTATTRRSIGKTCRRCANSSRAC